MGIVLLTLALIGVTVDGVNHYKEKQATQKQLVTTDETVDSSQNNLISEQENQEQAASSETVSDLTPQ